MRQNTKLQRITRERNWKFLRLNGAIVTLRSLELLTLEQIDDLERRGGDRIQSEFRRAKSELKPKPSPTPPNAT